MLLGVVISCAIPLWTVAPAAASWPAGDADRASRGPLTEESLVASATLRWPQIGDDTSASASESTLPESSTSPAEFSAGSWTFNTYGSAIFGDSGKGEMYLAHVGAGYYLGDYASLNIEVFGGYVRSGIDDDGVVGGFDLVYRNHFVRSEGDARTVFFEAGAGCQQASTDFSGHRHFNFRLRVGFGATFRLGDRSRLFLGANYIHISDAGIEGGGGGFDGPMVYVGLKLPF